MNHPNILRDQMRYDELHLRDGILVFGIEDCVIFVFTLNTQMSLLMENSTRSSKSRFLLLVLLLSFTLVQHIVESPDPNEPRP